MMGKIKMFNIGNMDIDSVDDIDEGIKFLKGIKFKLKGGKSD